MPISEWSSDVGSSDLNGCKALSRFHRAGKPRLSARYASGERRCDRDGVSVQTKHERHREPYRCTIKAQTGGYGQGSDQMRGNALPINPTAAYRRPTDIPDQWETAGLFFSSEKQKCGTGGSQTC